MAYTRQQLIMKRDSLRKQIGEVQEQLDKFDIEVYGGKMKKAIRLLSECLDYLNYPTVPLECPECAREIDVDLDEVIKGLECLCREEF